MPLFFGLGRPIEATLDIVALTGVTSYMALVWSQVDNVSGWLFTPYLGWLGFATYLSVSDSKAPFPGIITYLFKGGMRLLEQLGLRPRI